MSTNKQTALAEKVPVIPEVGAFYGCITSLGVQGYPAAGAPVYMYVMFSDQGKPAGVWRVPDADLFEALAEHLIEIAHEREFCTRHFEEPDDEQLWIGKEDGNWLVGYEDDEDDDED